MRKMNVVSVKEYGFKRSDGLCRAEVFRYAGIKNTDKISSETFSAINKTLDDYEKNLLPKLSYKVCWTESEIKVDENGEYAEFDFAKVFSKDLAAHLKDCDKAIIFAATLGIEFDRELAKQSVISPMSALVLQALGAERTEFLSDTFEDEISKCFRPKSTVPRFSPGYGDLSMEFQKTIFEVLQCQKYIGLTLNAGLLMTPSKSVTAVIGGKAR